MLTPALPFGDAALIFARACVLGVAQSAGGAMANKIVSRPWETCAASPQRRRRDRAGDVALLHHQPNEQKDHRGIVLTLALKSAASRDGTTSLKQRLDDESRS